MVFGILEPAIISGERVPGTALLAELEDPSLGLVNARVASRLKHGKGKNSHIVLVPQPSDDPNDPLNWSLLVRDGISLMFAFTIMTFAGAIGPLLSPFAFQLTLEYNVSFTKVSLLTGWQLLTVAISGLFVSPATRIYGKRPVLLLCSIIGFAGSVWLPFATSYNSLLGGRILQGVGVSAYESISFAFVADLYCVHQRGARIAFMLAPLGAINILCPLIAGVVAERLGIEWVYKIMAIMTGIALGVVIFCMPETTFRRDRSPILALLQEDSASEKLAAAVEKEHASTEPTIPKKRSYASQLHPFTGRVSSETWFQATTGPLRVMKNPAVYWSMFTQGAVSAWTVAVSMILSQVFGVAPYNMSPAGIGYLNVGGIVGGVVAEIVTIGLNDKIVKALAKANGGIFEPEFRLWSIVPMLVTGVVGFFGFGQAAAAGHSPVVVSMFYGFITASLVFSHVASGSYMTDAFPECTVEVFIDVMIFKNILFFVFSLVINEWIIKEGPAQVFNTIGGIQIVVCALSVPLWVLGKRNRWIMRRKV